MFHPNLFCLHCYSQSLKLVFGISALVCFFDSKFVQSSFKVLSVYDVRKKCSVELFQKHGRSVVWLQLPNLYAGCQKQGKQYVKPVQAPANKSSSPIRHQSKSLRQNTDILAAFPSRVCLIELNAAYSRKPMPPSNIAFNAVNKPGFQQLLNIVEPQYQIPSKTTFSKNKVVKRYDATRESVMADLSNMAFFSSR